MSEDSVPNVDVVQDVEENMLPNDITEITIVGRKWEKNCRRTVPIIFSLQEGSVLEEFEDLNIPVDYFLHYFDSEIV